MNDHLEENGNHPSQTFSGSEPSALDFMTDLEETFNDLDDELDEQERIATNIANGDDPEAEEVLVPTEPKPLSLDRASQYLTEQEKKVAELCEQLLAKHYTQITPDNILQWSEILGTDKAMEAHSLGGSDMLPEYYALFNLSTKSRAMMLVQLSVYAELMKAINDSNDMTIHLLATKFQQTIEKNLEKLTKEAVGTFQTAGTQTKNELTSILQTIDNSKTELKKVVAQGENARNGIQNAQKETLELIDNRIEKLFMDNLGKVVSKIASKVADKVDKEQWKALEVKTWLITVGCSVGTFLLGLMAGKHFL